MNYYTNFPTVVHIVTYKGDNCYIQPFSKYCNFKLSKVVLKMQKHKIDVLHILKKKISLTAERKARSTAHSILIQKVCLC